MARARRGRGEGSIFQRSDGRWCASVSFGNSTGTGKRLRRTIYGKTKSEVQKELARLHATGAPGESSDGTQTVVAYLKAWLEIAKPNLKRSTATEYTRVVEKFLVPYFGSAKLAKVTPMMVQHLYASIKSPFNRKHCHTVLHRAFGQAHKHGMLPSNPVALVDVPRTPKRAMTPVTVEDVEKLLAASEGTRYHALMMLAVLTGMRQGEIFGLQLRDWDRKNRTIHVQRALVEVSGKKELEEPKSDAARRVITLPQRLSDALAVHLKYVVADGRKSEFLFTGAKGKPLEKATFHRRVYKPLFLKAKVPYVRFHDLRHTMASLLLQAGVHPKVVQERLGHSSISITMDLYSHAVPSLQRDAADKLQSMFGT